MPRIGIAQASLVDNDEKLAERVTFIHEKIGTDALVEQYIEGREIYVGVLGNERLRVLPVWELEFGDLIEDANRSRPTAVKHDLEYQERHNITRARRRTDAGDRARASSASPSASAARWSSTAMPASISACRGQHALFHRGQSQSRDRPDRGVRPEPRSMTAFGIRRCWSACCGLAFAARERKRGSKRSSARRSRQAIDGEPDG